MTLRRRSAWEENADPRSGFEIHDPDWNHKPSDPLPPHLAALIRQSAENVAREQAAYEARMLRARRLSDEARKDGLERLRERWAG